MPKQYGGEITQAQKDSALKIGKILVLIIVILLVLWLCYLTWYRYSQRKNSEPMLITQPQDATQQFALNLVEQLYVHYNHNSGRMEMAMD